MKVRNAKITDAEAICSLVNYYAERDRMLFRSLSDIYEKMQCFIVVEDEQGRTAGCCAVEVVWADLAEIKSLAVDCTRTKQGFGAALVRTATEKAVEIGVSNIFALTLEPVFFEKLGFARIEKEKLPMKVWSDCATCPKQQHCDETAVIKTLQ